MLPLRILPVFIPLLLILLTSAIAAQPRPGEEINSLQKQIDDLRETQQSIQKELQEIKGLLQGRIAPPNIPPPTLALRVGTNSFKGDKDAKVVLIEFSDYQCPSAHDTSARPCHRLRETTLRQASSGMFFGTSP